MLTALLCYHAVLKRNFTKFILTKFGDPHNLILLVSFFCTQAASIVFVN